MASWGGGYTQRESRPLSPTRRAATPPWRSACRASSTRCSTAGSSAPPSSAGSSPTLPAACPPSVRLESSALLSFFFFCFFFSFELANMGCCVQSICRRWTRCMCAWWRTSRPSR